ncbi:GRP family sugar transporter [Enterococcus timonensis]|uniref:GRP family sugar transporter n=1 Tax=Enterococcus timonensis TaxID=1852364 RepID=UPI0008D91E51|nr:GRP family sugar transporter [Enterococcus timonensis]
MGLLYAIIPIFAWGSIGLVSGKIGGDANQQTLGMTLGALVFAIVATIILQPVIDLKTILVGLGAGFLWSLGQVGQFHGMKAMGVASALPLSTGMQLIVTTLIGVFAFGEWQTSRDFIFGLLALACLIVGSALTSRRDPNAPETGELHNYGRGIRALIISTVGYASYNAIINYFGVGAQAVILPQAVGMVIGALVFAGGKVKFEKVVLKNMASGLLWGTGNIFMLSAMKLIGLAVSFSLSQTGIIISTLGGIYILGEKKTKLEMRYIISGCLLVIVGGMLLGYLKSGA